MKQIATQLGVAQSTITEDLRNLSAVDKLKPAKTATNPKGAGRPRRTKSSQERRTAAASLVLDAGLSREKAGIQIGMRDKEIQLAVEFERGRRAAVPMVDPQTLSSTAQEKLDTAIRQYRTQLDYEYQEKLIKMNAQTRNELYIPKLEKLAWDIDVARRKGIMSGAEFRTIWSCLHPDSRISVTTEKLAEAFRIFERLKMMLLSSADAPASDLLPKTVADLLARRKKAHLN